MSIYGFIIVRFRALNEIYGTRHYSPSKSRRAGMPRVAAHFRASRTSLQQNRNGAGASVIDR